MSNKKDDKMSRALQLVTNELPDHGVLLIVFTLPEGDEGDLVLTEARTMSNVHPHVAAQVAAEFVNNVEELIENPEDAVRFLVPDDDEPESGGGLLN